MTVLISIIALILSSASAILVAVLSHKTAQNALLTLDSVHERQSKQTDQILDRLMAIDWERFAVMRDATESDAGGFYTPEEQRGEVTQEPVDRPGQWGALSDLRTRVRGVSPEEQELLDEDFPDSAEA